jgi:hypothetical protein
MFILLTSRRSLHIVFGSSGKCIICVFKQVGASFGLKKQGSSLDEEIAARPCAAYDGKWGRFPIDGSFLVRLVYTGV